MPTEGKEKHQTSTKILFFVKYINYNHLALGPKALVLGDYKSDIAFRAVITYTYIYIYNIYINYIIQDE